MVGITIILVGVVSVLVFSYANEATEEGDNYLFTTDMDASDDTLEISMMSGTSFFNTSKMRILIDEISLIDIPEKLIRSGELFVVETGFDVEPGATYEVKIVVDNRLMYEGFPVANP
jgi:hypothetical protein